MRTGWKLAALLLAVVVSPRMATADAFRLTQTSPQSAAEAVRAAKWYGHQPGCIRATALTADSDHGDGHTGRVSRRGWGIPRRWKLTARRLFGSHTETPRTALPQQRLEVVGRERRTKQETLSEIASQGP